MNSNSFSRIAKTQSEEISEDDYNFLYELVLRGYKNSIDDEIQETIGSTTK